MRISRSKAAGSKSALNKKRTLSPQGKNAVSSTPDSGGCIKSKAIQQKLNLGSKKQPSNASTTDVPTSPSDQEPGSAVRQSTRKTAPIEEIAKSDLQEKPAPLGREMRKKTPKLYDFFGTGKENIAGSESSDFIERKTKKRDKKAKTKKISLLKEKKEEVAGDNEKRKVPLGVSVFDLIMPWKSDVVGQDTSNLCKNGLSKVVTCSSKSKVLDICLDDHAEDVQAVLMNPPWENSFTKDKQSRKISIEDFKKGFQISTKVMKDGLVFIWVEKELICDLIKCFEAQDFFYVENVCYVMLDQMKKKGIDDSRDIDISDSFVREDYQFIKKTKKTLLIFRRMSQKKAKCTLELRHQRTCDVCFDWASLEKDAYPGIDLINNDGIIRQDDFKPHNYMYKMIETMLPKAMVEESKKKIRLLEMWGQNDDSRKGWVKIVQK